MDDNGRTVERMPSTIGRYQVQDCIGIGAMGAVYKAFDPLIKRTLAIKTIRLDIPRNSPQYKSFIERFYHEARISGTLSHPNIVTLFDIGEEGGLPFLAMEYAEGQTIADIVERGERFRPERVIGLISQVASAIDYAHSKGVIHRDIKPSNLILSDAERVKVTDFGIAKVAGADLTQAGTLLGTPSYMSPEQAMGEPLDGRTDIFSLGVCAFEMLSGEQPFPGNNVTSILYKLVHVDPIEPANLEMNGLVPERWHKVFSKVLAKKPDERYQTAGEFVQDLEYCLGSWFGALDVLGGEEARKPAPPAVPSPAPPKAAQRTGIRVKPPTLLPGARAVVAPPSASLAALPVPVPAPPPPPPPPVEEPVVPPTMALRTIPPGAARVPPAPVAEDRVAEGGAPSAPISETNRTIPSAPAPAAAPAAREDVQDVPGEAAAQETAVSYAEPTPATEESEQPDGATVVIMDRPEIAEDLAYEAAPPPDGADATMLVMDGQEATYLMAAPEPVPATVAMPVELPITAAMPVGVAEAPVIARPTPPPPPRPAPPPPPQPQPQPQPPRRATAPPAGPTVLQPVYDPAAVAVPPPPRSAGPSVALLVAGGLFFILAGAGVGLLVVKRTSDATPPPTAPPATTAAVETTTPPPPTRPAPPRVDPARVYVNSELDQQPVKLGGDWPTYPRKAPPLSAGETVAVDVSFTVTEEGGTADAKIEKSGGKVLDDAVLKALRSFRYQPGEKQGVTVKTRLLVRKSYKGG